MSSVAPLVRWHTVFPTLALIGLILGWGTKPPALALAALAVLLGGSVLAAVHHAEVIAARVGEPFGSLVLAVAVTVIEVGLIIMLMLSSAATTSSLARDTVFAAVMITLNGIVGLSLVVGGFKFGAPRLNESGSATGLATTATIAVLALVVPSFTTSEPGPVFSGVQLAFAAVASLLLWGLYVFTQTVRHRDFFLPVDDDGRPISENVHAETPTLKAALTSLGFLLGALVAVVGLAKILSPAIEGGVAGAGLPASFVGVVIALLVLLPETLAAARNAARNRLQISLNLAYGSALASIGLTIPVLALATLWLPVRLELGLGPVHLVLLALSVVVSTLTLFTGRATRMEGAVHLAILAAYVFLSAVP
nr:ionic transporter y4hA [Propionibacterium sp.]